MNVKVCDRCRKEFVLQGESHFVPRDEAARQQGGNPPPGLLPLNQFTLPVGVRPEKEQPERRFVLMKMDLCAPCVVELVPAIAKWVEEKRTAKA